MTENRKISELTEVTTLSGNDELVFVKYEDGNPGPEPTPTPTPTPALAPPEVEVTIDTSNGSEIYSSSIVYPNSRDYYSISNPENTRTKITIKATGTPLPTIIKQSSNGNYEEDAFVLTDNGIKQENGISYREATLQLIDIPDYESPSVYGNSPSLNIQIMNEAWWGIYPPYEILIDLSITNVAPTPTPLTLAVPQNVRTTGDRFELEWDAVENATSYLLKLYQNDGSDNFGGYGKLSHMIPNQLNTKYSLGVLGGCCSFVRIEIVTEFANGHTSTSPSYFLHYPMSRMDTHEWLLDQQKVKVSHPEFGRTQLRVLDETGVPCPFDFISDNTWDFQVCTGTYQVRTSVFPQTKFDDENLSEHGTLIKSTDEVWGKWSDVLTIPTE